MNGVRGRRVWDHIKFAFILSLVLTLSLLIHSERVVAEEDQRTGTIVNGNITLREEEIYVQPDGNNYTEVKIYGELNHKIGWSPGTSYVIGTFHSDLKDWNITLPQPMNLKNPRPKPFNMIVQIPGNESGWTNKTISIWAEWEDHPSGNKGNFTMDNVTIFVNGYYHLEIEHQKNVTIKAGEKKTVDLNVYNLGNNDDAPDIYIMNLTEWKERNWKFQLSQSKHYYSSGTNETHPLTIEVPFNERSGDHEIHLQLISRFGKQLGQNATINYTINVHVEGKLYFDIGPGNAISISAITLVLIISLIVVIVIKRKKLISS